MKMIQSHIKIIFTCLIALFAFREINAQGALVRGVVKASSSTIISAVVTFVNESDTTKQVSALTDATGYYSLNLLTSIESANSIPAEFELDQNYPNPFSSSTAISYKLNKQTDVQLTIYDILGREVRKFTVGNKNIGVHGIQWDAKNNFGQKLSAGVYFYQLLAGNKSITKKMVLGTNQQDNYSIPAILSSRQSQEVNLKKSSVQSGSYQIRISNSARTNPLITPKQINNVLIVRDTTINISVDKAPIFATADIYIDSVRQIVRGFGAANILLWRPDMTDAEIKSAFGTGDGQLGFSILRIMTEADSNRWGLNLPTTKKAQDMGVTIIASPWYAPSTMVESVTEAGKARSHVRYDMYNKYAAHLNSFNRYMKNNGVNIYGLSVQNEPDITDSWTSWSANEMLTFMKSYANAIEGTKVMAPESFQFRREMSDPILNDSAACANTDIICGHLYGGGLYSYPLAAKKGKEVWMTEYLSGEKSNANDWSWAFPVAKQMHDVLQAGMSSYVWWYLVRFYGPISDGTSNSGNKGDITKKGFVMSQFSKFIRPGYHVIKSTSSRNSVNVTAAKGDLSKLVVVAVNNDTEPITQTFSLKNSNANSFATYTTTSSKDCEKGTDITVSSGSFTITLAPSSVTTFVAK